MSTRLEETLTLADDVSPTSRMSIVGDVIQTIQERLIYFGVKNELVYQANKTITNVLESFIFDKSIENLFNTIRTATKGHLLQHSLMTTYLSNIIIRNLDWNTISNQEKITMASLFHDIALAHNNFQEQEKKSFLIGIDKTDKNVPNEFIRHPQKSVELLSKVPNIPDLFTIILEHHERPDGSGFPRGLKANRISPLSCILIVAHHACELIELNDSQKEKKNILKSLEDEYKEGHFAQIVQSFKESLK
jgi:putative nucleotidyltransferase with HDIG domain